MVIGRLSERKGQHVLLEALSDPRFGASNPLVHICGEPYNSPGAIEYAEKIEGEAQKLSSQVLFHGFVPTPDALKLGGIVVVPSTLSEPFGLVAAESLVAGRAVIASKCGGLPDILGDAGVLVEPDNPRALADAVLSLLSNDSRRTELMNLAKLRGKNFDTQHYFHQN